jgi:N-acylneuraminate cytidylyltransferase
MKNIIAIIPAREGSKGVPLKNMALVNNKPLIDWTIDAALHSKYISAIVVSSDSDVILNHVKQNDNVICIVRPSNLAKDDTPTEPVIIHALEQLEDKEFDIVLLLQPTSPLRTSEDIDNAYEAFIKSEATALISVTEPKHHPLKSFKKNDEGYLEGLVNDKFPFMPRQELPEVYQPNGAIYMIYKKDFLESYKLITTSTIPFMMSLENSIDIDTLDDIKIVERLLKKNVNE